MITAKDKIGYIRRSNDGNGKETFKYIEGKIKRINIGKTRTSIYSDRFRALDMEEVEWNTEMMTDGRGLILVNEPFITNEELAERCKAHCEYWNEFGATSIFDAVGR